MSYEKISDAMAPVVAAPTIQDAQNILGIVPPVPPVPPAAPEPVFTPVAGTDGQYVITGALPKVVVNSDSTSVFLPEGSNTPKVSVKVLSSSAPTLINPTNAQSIDGGGSVTLLPGDCCSLEFCVALNTWLRI